LENPQDLSIEPFRVSDEAQMLPPNLSLLMKGVEHGNRASDHFGARCVFRLGQDIEKVGQLLADLDIQTDLGHRRHISNAFLSLLQSPCAPGKGGSMPLSSIWLIGSLKLSPWRQSRLQGLLQGDVW
jgi:hypothetical protein